MIETSENKIKVDIYKDFIKNIQKVFDNCKSLTILEMRMYLRGEILSLNATDRNMSLDNKFYLYNLNSFLYFCNEFKDKETILSKMKSHCSKDFKNRYETK
jgi:hypothetical protein